MTRQPLVSTILIFLNAERFIEEAIASVFRQTYTNWELLLVDDGSTDRSTEIARRYAASNPDRVRYLEHENHQNRRMSASRNLGLRHANGQYIALIDSDDVWLPQKLARQVAILEANPDAGMVYGASLYWRSWNASGDQAAKDESPVLGVEVGRTHPPPVLLSRQLTGKACSPCPSDVMLRQEVARSVGGFEDGFDDLFEDQAFFAKVKLAAPIFVSDECWDKYRLHPDSHCAVAGRDGRLAAARRSYLEWLEAHLRKRHVHDADVWRALRGELRPYRHPFATRVSALCRYVLTDPSRALRGGVRRVVPAPLRTRLRRSWRRAAAPGVGKVRLGDLRRVQPLSRRFGFERGLPVDRYYIERFLSVHTADIGGRVLEVKDDRYTRQFGGERVRHTDVLHVVPGNPKATIVADLSTDAVAVPSDAFDCAIITQVLPFIRDGAAAIRTLYRSLAPGGCLLVTMPGISQIDRHEMDNWGDYWRFTSLSARRLFEAVFPPEHVSVTVYGNVLAATALLYGLASTELRRDELDTRDPDYEVLIAVRAVKPRP